VEGSEKLFQISEERLSSRKKIELKCFALRRRREIQLFFKKRENSFLASSSCYI